MAAAFFVLLEATVGFDHPRWFPPKNSVFFAEKTTARKLAKALKRNEGAKRQKASSLGLSLDSRAWNWVHRKGPHERGP